MNEISRLNQIAETKKCHINNSIYILNYNIKEDNYEIIKFNYSKYNELFRTIIRKKLTKQQAIELFKFYLDLLEVEY